MSQPESVEYFELDGRTHAFVGVWGNSGVFVLSAGGGWEFHPQDSTAWDSLHQATYRNHKADRLPSERVRALPPLPPLPETTAVSWGDEFRLTRPELLRAPALVQWVRAAPGGRATVYYVLHEDRYESSFGDGVFRYLHAVFPTESAARAFLTGSDGPRSEWDAWHLRTLTLALEGEAVVLARFEPQRYDHAKADEIIEALLKVL